MNHSILINLDFDGVVVDSLTDLLQKAVQAQAAIGRGRVPTLDDIQVLQNMTFQDLGIQCGMPMTTVPQFIHHIFNLQQQQSAPPQLFAGMADVLRQWGQDYAIAIVTSSDRTAVEQVLQQHHLKAMIPLILDGQMAESKCEKIAIAQQYFKIPATRTYMIGDAISDIRQGKLAGVQTIAVTWGFQRRDLLLAEQPDYVVDSPAELKQFAFAAKLLDG